MTPNRLLEDAVKWELEKPITKLPFWFRKWFGIRCKCCRTKMIILTLDLKGGREVWGCPICNAQKKQAVLLIFTKPPYIPEAKK